MTIQEACELLEFCHLSMKLSQVNDGLLQSISKCTEEINEIHPNIGSRWRNHKITAINGLNLISRYRGSPFQKNHTP